MTNKKPQNEITSVENNIRRIKENISQAAELAGRDLSDISLMAVTKTVSPELVNVALDNGISLFGENRVQEYLSKIDAYSFNSDKVHFIGHLQSNKVKYIIDKVSMIESVSSIKLLQEIDKSAKKHSLNMDILLEVNIGNEESKSGFLPEQLDEAVKIADSMQNVTLKGLMTIPPKNNVDYYFAKMQQLFVDFSDKKLDNNSMGVLSMGMSGDYATAVKYGSNILRLGTAIFGKRF